MKIDGADLFQQLQTTALEAGAPRTENVQPRNTAQVDFGQLLKQALDNVNELQGNANQMATRFEMGDESVSLGDVMVARSKSSIAFDATLQVRNKLVEAYQDVLKSSI